MRPFFGFDGNTNQNANRHRLPAQRSRCESRMFYRADRRLAERIGSVTEDLNLQGRAISANDHLHPPLNCRTRLN